MGDINDALAASRDAVDRLIAHAESSGHAWMTPRGPGKWSPSQIVEHVARSLDASVDLASGGPSSFPKLPAMLHPLLRLVFRRVLKKSAFPKGKTTAAMNPAAGPATPRDGRARLEEAHQRFEVACRGLAARRAPMPTPMFGAVPVEDFVRFMELHTRHHDRQISAR
jgi:DinB superfamily